MPSTASPPLGKTTRNRDPIGDSVLARMGPHRLWWHPNGRVAGEVNGPERPHSHSSCLSFKCTSYNECCHHRPRIRLEEVARTWCHRGRANDECCRLRGLITVAVRVLRSWTCVSAVLCDCRRRVSTERRRSSASSQTWAQCRLRGQTRPRWCDCALGIIASSLVWTLLSGVAFCRTVASV